METDPSTQATLVAKACEKLKVTLLTIRRLIDWERDFGISYSKGFFIIISYSFNLAFQLSPFPFQNKDSITMCDALALIDLALRALRLGIVVDQWKKTLATLAPNFVQTFKFFENNYKAVFVGNKALSADEAAIVSDPMLITQCTEWFETTV